MEAATGSGGHAVGRSMQKEVQDRAQAAGNTKHVAVELGMTRVVID